MKQGLTDYFNRVWYETPSVAANLLDPLSRLTRHFTTRKRQGYLSGQSACFRAPVPVIVVGNITVGGTGKTPLVIWLVQQLQKRGYKPGIVTRGYGGQPPAYPHLVLPDDSAAVAGDEPLLLRRRTGVPVMADPQRVNAVQALLAQTDCNVIVSDDGLQHYRLGRSYEILMLDGKRGLGNGRLLPAGPLRESSLRLEQVNARVINGAAAHSSLAELPTEQTFEMALIPGEFIALQNAGKASAQQLRQHDDWIAVAGIGNPERFFSTLESLNIRFQKAVFPDHHQYRLQDFSALGNGPVITTEKDAVKLQGLSVQGWYLPVEAQLQPGLINDILAAIERFQRQPFHLY